MKSIGNGISMAENDPKASVPAYICVCVCVWGLECGKEGKRGRSIVRSTSVLYRTVQAF